MYTKYEVDDYLSGDCYDRESDIATGTGFISGQAC
jgi:hypothetical protein